MNEDLQNNDKQENAIQKFKEHMEYRKKIKLVAIIITAILCLWMLEYSVPMTVLAVLAMSVGHTKFMMILVGSILATTGSILFIKNSFKKMFRYEFAILIAVSFMLIWGTLNLLPKEELMNTYNDIAEKYSPDSKRMELDKDGNPVFYDVEDTEDEYDVEMDVVAR